jgi:hypothetical protein
MQISGMEVLHMLMNAIVTDMRFAMTYLLLTLCYLCAEKTVITL